MLALRFRRQSLIGIIDHSILNLCYSAAFGCGAHCNGQRIMIKDDLSPNLNPREILCLGPWRAAHQSKAGRLFDVLLQKHPAVRMYFDCFGLSRAIHGQAGAMLEFNVHLWDLAACQVLAEEAGGSYFDPGPWRNQDGELRYSAVFGKPSVVQIIRKMFEELCT